MMPSRISSRTGRMMANSTITAPPSSRLILDIVGLLRASDRELAEGGSGRRRTAAPAAFRACTTSGQGVDDVLEEAVDRTAQDEDSAKDGDGDEGDEDAVLDHRGALVVLPPGGDERLKEGDDAHH